MITYNHEMYIKEAVLGVLAQTTDFDFELLVADDCSPDNTEFVIKQVIKNHPINKKIKYTRHDENKGMLPNFVWALGESKGEYIALCEGDDFWSDPYKLQKQIDFLEANNNYSVSGHNSDCIKGDILRKLLPNNYSGIKTIRDALLGYFSHTSSLVFRKNLINNDFFEQLKHAPVGDAPLICHLLNKQNGFVLDETMSVYRVHSKGIHSSLNSEEVLVIAIKTQIWKLKYFPKYKQAQCRKIFESTIKLIKKNGNIFFMINFTFIEFFYILGSFLTIALNKFKRKIFF